MFRFLHFRLVAAALAVACVVGSASPAKATFTIYLQEAGVNSGNITAVATGGDFVPLNFSGVYGDFTVSVFGGSSINGANLSILQSSTSTVINNTGTSHTLKLWVSQTNYTLPTGTPLHVESGLSGTLTAGTVGTTGIFQGYAANSNTLLDTSGFSTGSQDVVLMVGNQWLTNTATGTFPRTNATSPFSLTSVVTLAMSGGAVMNFSSQISVTPTPAPAGVVLVASVLPFVALLRRRLRKSDAVTAA